MHMRDYRSTKVSSVSNPRGENTTEGLELQMISVGVNTTEAKTPSFASINNIATEHGQLYFDDSRIYTTISLIRPWSGSVAVR